MWNQSKLNEAAQFTDPKKNSLQRVVWFIGADDEKSYCRLFFFTDLEDKILTAKQQQSLAGDALRDESESPQCASTVKGLHS